MMVKMREAVSRMTDTFDVNHTFYVLFVGERDE